MRKYILLISSILFLVKISIGQNSFEFGIDTEEDCIVWEGTVDNNGNFLGIGIIGSFVNSSYDAYIIKVFPDGNYISKAFPKTDTISMFSTIDLLSNGNYFIVGSYNVNGNSQERNHLWCVTLDPELNILNEKSYLIRNPYIGFGTSACSLTDNDGNILIAAIAMVEDSDEKTVFADLAFYKFNQLGDTIKSQYYEYIWDEWPWEFKQVPNSNNLMLIERSTHYNGHDELLFLDQDFNILEINQFGNEDAIISGDLSSDYWTSDTSFLLSGYNSFAKDPCTEPYIGVYLVDTSAIFHQELVLNKIDTADYPAKRNSMAYANDSTIYIGGFQTYIDLWSTEPTIVELYVIDQNLNLLGFKGLGGDMNHKVWGIVATPDNGCLVYGTSYSNEAVPERDIHIWKVIREDISIITEISETQDQTSGVRLFPNPVEDHLSINLGQNQSWNKLSLSIYSVEGKKVFQKQLQGEGNLLTTNLHNIGTGIYIIQLSNSHHIIHSEKIIIK